ncbi:MAG TPA: hypothetical protein VD913_01705 [bacterium]|nr:hypothetical protein [bacterium]
MKKRQALFFFVPLVFVFILLGFLFAYRHVLTVSILEYLFNRNTKEFFEGTVRLSGVRLEPNGRLLIDRFDGNLQTGAGAVPLEIRQIRSENSVIHYFSKGGFRLNFKSLRPSYSPREGVDGVLILRGGKAWFFDLKATVRGIDLEDIVTFNPEFLEGSRGKMRGELSLYSAYGEDPRISAALSVEKPGGKLQSQFFEGIFPYLPKSVAKKQVKKLSNARELVDFDNAKLEINVPRSDRIKVFLHILVPDYNLNLNLNMEIRVDDKEVLTELFQIMGIIRVKVAA